MTLQCRHLGLVVLFNPHFRQNLPRVSETLTKYFSEHFLRIAADIPVASLQKPPVSQKVDQPHLKAVLGF